MDERLKHKLVAAKEHFERREFERAEPLLLQILEKHDGFADLHNMLGIVRHDRGDFSGAKQAFERAVELNPRYTEAILNLVVACNDLGDYDGGRELFARLRAGSSPSVDGTVQDVFALGKIANMHADLAKGYADAGFAAEAIRELRTAVALRPGFADLHVKLGALLRDAGQLEAARASFQAACDANPQYVHGRVQLGLCLHMLQDKEGASMAFRAVLDGEPGHKIAAMYLRLVEGRPT